MREWYRYCAAMLSLVLVASVGCGRQSAPEPPERKSVTLAQVRKSAELALDSTLSGKQRQQARDEAMSLLLSLLKQPDSLQISREDWERPLSAGARVMRVFTSGPVRLYSLTLPASGVVPPGERVAIQFQPENGSLQSFELEVMQGGRLVAARALEQRGSYSVTLAFNLTSGGGYVAHYQRDSRTGEFKLNTNAYRGIPVRVGDLTLEQRNGFLVVTTPLDEMWRPAFEEKHPLRLFLTADLGIDWKDRFELVDERNFNAFQGFVTALDTKAPLEQRREAWEKATHKLPAYLQEMASWGDDFTAKLPTGGSLQRDQLANLEVRVVGLPAPDLAGERSFTVVQYRIGGGFPSAQVLTLPGVMDSFRLINANGVPGLMVLSRTGAATGPLQRVLSLFRLTGGNDWAPAPDWLGAFPEDLAIRLSPQSNHLIIDGVEGSTVHLIGEAATVKLCSQPGSCFDLVWAGDRLGISGAVVDVGPGLNPEVGPGSPGPEDLSQAAEVVDLGQGVRVATMPSSRPGSSQVLIQVGDDVIAESITTGAVDRWSDARVVEAGGKRWLLLVGRSSTAAAVLLFQWDGVAWQPANAVDQSIDRIIMERARITYLPGQMEPVRGLYLSSSAPVSVSFTPDSTGLRLCETAQACLTYQYVDRWVLK